MPIYVLWIPCLEDRLTIRETKINNYNISDTDISLIDAEINTEWQIIIKYEYNKIKQEIVLTPYCPAKRGFLYYTLTSQTENESQLARSLHVKFHQGLYHIIKSFFHKHIHHPKEEDSILHARFFNTEDEYKEKTKGDAEFYIEEYIKKFTYLRNNIADCLSEVREKENSDWSRILHYLTIYRAYKRLTDKLLRYEGEYIYYKSLRKSVDEELKDAELYDRKMSLLDKEIRISLHYAENAFNYNSSIIGTHVSSLGLLISIISIVLALVITFTDKSERQLHSVSEQLDKIDMNVDIQNESIKDMSKQLEITTEKVDTLSFRYSRLHDRLQKFTLNFNISKKIGK